MTLTIADLHAGMPVSWNYVPRGGYGFGYHVPSVVVKVGRSRVTIDATLKSGGTLRRVVHFTALSLPKPVDPQDDWDRAERDMAKLSTVRDLFAIIGNTLAPYIYRPANEAALQHRVHAILTEAGHKAEREIRVPGGSQYDITVIEPLSGVQIVLELKTQGTASAAERQAQRYAIADSIDGVMVVTTSARIYASISRPGLGTLGGKPFNVIQLHRGF